MSAFDEKLRPPTYGKSVAEGVYLLQQAAYECSLGSLSYQLRAERPSPLPGKQKLIHERELHQQIDGKVVAAAGLHRWLTRTVYLR